MGCCLLPYLFGAKPLLIGALGSALLAPARSGSGLLGLLVLPLFVPILVFGAGTTMAHVGGAEVTAQLALLGGFLVLALSLLPAGIAVVTNSDRVIDVTKMAMVSSLGLSTLCV